MSTFYDNTSFTYNIAELSYYENLYKYQSNYALINLDTLFANYGQYYYAMTDIIEYIALFLSDNLLVGDDENTVNINGVKFLYNHDDLTDRVKIICDNYGLNIDDYDIFVFDIVYTFTRKLEYVANKLGAVSYGFIYGGFVNGRSNTILILLQGIDMDLSTRRQLIFEELGEKGTQTTTYEYINYLVKFTDPFSPFIEIDIPVDLTLPFINIRGIDTASAILESYIIWTKKSGMYLSESIR